MENEKTIMPVIETTPKWLRWLIHIVPWGIIMCLPVLFFSGIEEMDLTGERYAKFMVSLISFMLVFYINYFYLINRYLFKKQTVRYLLMNLLFILLLQGGEHFFDHYVFHASELERPEGPAGPFGFEPNWLQIMAAYLVVTAMYLLVAAVSVAFKMTSSWYIAEAKRKELERSQSEAELQNLKSQLNPHFLFNTLNNIYSLIAISPDRAQEAVHDLSRLLRYVMYESSQQFIPLEKDLDFVRNYVELMRIRLPGHVELRMEIGEIKAGTLVAPLLFISLIENAFKHGVSNNKPSFIHIDIHQEGNQVVCLIENSDFHKKTEQDKSGSGIGLVNLDKRLKLLYPENHIFECQSDGATYRSYLSITVKDSL
ncbi:histidine kinase [Parabacteroides sp. PF5-9]|uniref:sensor histidine kinase n=1 Tax=Parabacteroides sp. PF5-9 TaxID=1742404 RepID=UPI002475EF8D|nr:histidine kinase [Parabacteroides sp. PF5-9]MDH6356396.1 two-component sensor histidine kinase [Parabacteroides sp. PF5-9]